MGCQGELIVIAAFGSTDDLSLDLKGFCCIDDRFSMLVGNVDFHPLSHVEDLVHFFVACLRRGLDGVEHGWHGKQLILDVVHVLSEFKALRKGAPGAMDEAFNVGSEFPKQMLYDRRVTARWAQ